MVYVGEIIDSKTTWSHDKSEVQSIGPTWLGHIGQNISEVSNDLIRGDRLSA